MISLFFFIVGFSLGWFFRGTRAAAWIMSWLKPTATT